MRQIKCSVVGLGKLGAPLAAILAKHYPTVGVDLNRAYVDAINERRAPVNEPGLEELLKSSTKLSATTEIAVAVAQSNVTFVIVPTPSGADGKFSNQYVLNAVREIGAALKDQDERDQAQGKSPNEYKYHLVNITSTVMPGSTGGEIRAALEASSGRKVGETLGLTYNPEFIALGNVIAGIEKPDMILIGESHYGSIEGAKLKAIYKKVCPECTNIACDTWVNAETTKLALNSYLGLKISFANTLGQICDVMPGADASVVTKFLGFDKRISPKFLSPSLPSGGPCLPRDLVAMSSLGRDYAVSMDLFESASKSNNGHATWVFNKVRATAKPGLTSIGILGLSYKAETDVTEGSAGIQLAMSLLHAGYIVEAFDPLVKPNSASVKHLTAFDNFSYADTIDNIVKNSDVLVVTTPTKIFGELTILAARPNFPKVVIDCWRMFQHGELPNVKLIHIGENELRVTESRKREKEAAVTITPATKRNRLSQ